MPPVVPHADLLPKSRTKTQPRLAVAASRNIRATSGRPSRFPPAGVGCQEGFRPTGAAAGGNRTQGEGQAASPVQALIKEKAQVDYPCIIQRFLLLIPFAGSSIAGENQYLSNLI
jgi:hypothetical protein